MAFGTPAWGDGFKIWGVAVQTLGIPHPAIDVAGEIGQANIPLAGSGFPPLHFAGSAMIYFQFVFAAITPILIAGSVLGRVNFKAWMLFVPLWSSLVYTVGAFMLWGGGWLAGLGAVDYSGGYVIHLAAGLSGFVAAAMVGPRLLEDRKSFDPNDLIIPLAGAGRLPPWWNRVQRGCTRFASSCS